ncbi:MAG TPA: hypothetical protein VEZ90_13275 [Blastocatellia bacterium]|nr:hypothetical protein [Blastocatellia bacterium]
MRTKLIPFALVLVFVLPFTPARSFWRSTPGFCVALADDGCGHETAGNGPHLTIVPHNNSTNSGNRQSTPPPNFAGSQAGASDIFAIAMGFFLWVTRL